MINGQLQYEITKTLVKKFRNSLKVLLDEMPLQYFERIREIEIDAIRSQLIDLENDVQQNENLMGL